jgi:ADP-heptose:LPS heptosyltransferase
MIPVKARLASPLRGIYLVRSIPKNLCLRLIDGILKVGRALANPRDSHRAVNPRRILVANGAALGDVILATAVLPVLKSAYPDADLGMLVGTGSKPVLADHPLLRWVHTVDHWRMDRSDRTAWAKWIRYKRTRAVALREVKSVAYDVAIDLYYFFPNSVLFLWQAGIPVRVGYTSAGLGPLLTHPTLWQLRDCSVIDYHADLVRRLGVPASHFSKLAPNLPRATGDAGRSRFGGLGSSDEYLVLHIGTGFAIKEWPVEKWKSLVTRLAGGGRRLVFTGAGPKEAKTVELVIENMPNCINLCNLLSWPEYVSVIAGARGLLGVDSVAAHVAAAVGTPCVVIAPGTANRWHWRPRSADCTVLVYPVPCSPCYRQYGCANMECVRSVSIGDVLSEANRLFVHSPIRAVTS